MFGFSFNEDKIGIPRNLFCDALKAEGIPCSPGYVEPLYLNPLYQEKRAFAFKHYTGKANYQKGICPVAENLHEKQLINTIICRPPAKIDDMQDVIDAIKKIIENKQELLN
jgi:dTDP-4-amino-4,6-dideoxygalactose transaminase